MMRRKKDSSEIKRTVGAKVNATKVNSEHHKNRSNNQTDTLKETTRKAM
jgi:hypothetical protein